MQPAEHELSKIKDLIYVLFLTPPDLGNRSGGVFLILASIMVLWMGQLIHVLFLTPPTCFLSRRLEVIHVFSLTQTYI